MSEGPNVSAVWSNTACSTSRSYFFQPVHARFPPWFLFCFLMVSASCQFYNLFYSHILRVDGNPFIKTCIQTNLAVSAVYLPHIIDPEANYINVWVAIALTRDSAFMPIWFYRKFINDVFGNKHCEIRFLSSVLGPMWPQGVMGGHWYTATSPSIPGIYSLFANTMVTGWSSVMKTPL